MNRKNAWALSVVKHTGVKMCCAFCDNFTPSKLYFSLVALLLHTHTMLQAFRYHLLPPPSCLKHVRHSGDRHDILMCFLQQVQTLSDINSVAWSISVTLSSSERRELEKAGLVAHTRTPACTTAALPHAPPPPAALHRATTLHLSYCLHAPRTPAARYTHAARTATYTPHRALPAHARIEPSVPG